MAWRQEHGKPGHAAPLDGEKDLSWKPGGGGQAAKERAKEMRKYAEQRALQKESEREARRSEKAAAERQLKEIKAAVTSLDISAEDVRPICRFFELGKCNKGAKCKFRHEAAAAAPEGGADAPAPAFDVVAEMPADAWLQVLSRLGVGGACSLAAVCSSLAAIVGTPGVWEEKRANVFGGGAEERGGEERGGEGGEAAARRECCVSEASLHGWARASLEPPSELPLGELTSAAIAGSLGLSTHRGKMVRLWEAKSGRRLGAMALKEQPFGCDVGVVGVRKGACDVAGCRTVAAVGDVDGRLYLLDLEEPLESRTQRGPFSPRGGDPAGGLEPREVMCSVVLLQGSGRAGARRGGGGGGGGGGAPAPKVVIPRNAHKSALHALVTSGAAPVWLDSRWDAAQQLVLDADVGASLPSLLERHGGEIAAVLLVSPTYHGVLSDVEAASRLCRAAGVPLIVDEAHGSHLGMAPGLPRPALSRGADLVIQSSHKTLGAMTQAAMLHISADCPLPHGVVPQALELVQSSSPSYLLLASLDAARWQYADADARRDTAAAIALAQQARCRLSQLPGVRVFAPPGGGAAGGGVETDPLRVVVRCDDAGSGFDLDEALIERHGVYCELPELRHLTFAFSLGTTQGDVDLLVEALRDVTADADAAPFAAAADDAASAPAASASEAAPAAPAPVWLPLPAAVADGRGLTPREAFFAPSELVDAREAVGRLSAELVCSYPPGIPVFFPGEPITAEALQHIRALRAAGADVCGCSDASLARLCVVVE